MHRCIMRKTTLMLKKNHVACGDPVTPLQGLQTKTALMFIWARNDASTSVINSINRFILAPLEKKKTNNYEGNLVKMIKYT